MEILLFKTFFNKIIEAIKIMSNLDYWNKPNSVEFFAFMTKLIIIFPGLIFGYQILEYLLFSNLLSFFN